MPPLFYLSELAREKRGSETVDGFLGASALMLVGR